MFLKKTVYINKTGLHCNSFVFHSFHCGRERKSKKWFFFFFIPMERMIPFFLQFHHTKKYQPNMLPEHGRILRVSPSHSRPIPAYFLRGEIKHLLLGFGITKKRTKKGLKPLCCGRLIYLGSTPSFLILEHCAGLVLFSEKKKL